MHTTHIFTRRMEMSWTVNKLRTFENEVYNESSPLFGNKPIHHNNIWYLQVGLDDCIAHTTRSLY